MYIYIYILYRAESAEADLKSRFGEVMTAQKPGSGTCFTIPSNSHDHSTAQVTLYNTSTGQTERCRSSHDRCMSAFDQ